MTENVLVRRLYDHSSSLNRIVRYRKQRKALHAQGRIALGQPIRRMRWTDFGGIEDRKAFELTIHADRYWRAHHAGTNGEQAIARRLAIKAA